MQQPLRSVRPQYNVRSGVVHRSEAVPASVPPLTPRKANELDDLIESLEDKYKLGFMTQSGLRSPATAKSKADIALKKIRYLFFSDKPALHDALARFATALTGPAKDQRLDELLRILRRKTSHESTKAKLGTPNSERDVLPKTSQSSVENTPCSRRRVRNDKSTSSHAKIPDHESPTDEDEGDYATPLSRRAISRSLSPSVTSKSAKRRVEASAHLSLPSNARKRPSDELNEIGESPKLTKTAKGGQRFIKPQVPPWSKPAPSVLKGSLLDAARSFKDVSASQSTVNTSFNTISSSQQTRADTANTSFASDACYTEVPKALSTRTSSTTMGSLDDQDLLTIDAKLCEEAPVLEARPEPLSTPSQGRDSSSTWGSSLPEEEWLGASARVESMHAKSPVGRRQLSPQRPAQQIGGSQPTRSSTRDGNSALAKSAAAAVNQSFPPPPDINAKLFPDTAALHLQSPASNGRTLTRGHRHSPRERTPVESPSKIAYQIRDIPRQGLFVSKPDSRWQVMPYYALFICQRIALERSAPLSELIENMDVALACADPAAFWTSIFRHPKVALIKFRDSDDLWSAAKSRYNGYTFKGQINLRSRKSGPMFELDLHPILSDKSCRLQRKFGADRFLYLNVPELDVKNWSGGTQDDLTHVRKSWNQWLDTEHEFLLRKWRVFLIAPMKKSKTKGRNQEVTHKFRIVLFATEGYDIKRKCTVGEMLNWFFPFAQNLEQSFCKAFARFDLGLSRTTPTLVFEPSQIIRVRDTLANGDREASEFDDPRCSEWGHIPDGQVMSDGCAVMSVGAALQIWRIYNKNSRSKQPLPSAFQGRIGGAKGMWMISNESFTKDPDHLSIWIKITDSQLKFNPHPEDLSDDTRDPLRTTFEVSNYSQTPAHSGLHISFISIMTDRGAPREVIENCVRERLDADRCDLLERIKDPVKLHDYVHKNGATWREESDMAWQAAMPASIDEKIKLLIQSGFSPLELEILAKNVCRFIMKFHLQQESKFKIPLGKATYLYGVADPLGVLNPGEVHVQFSSSLIDDMTDETYLNLKGHNILVARQPAIRNSDIQKVRATIHPDLSHLVDVVVFPSRGQFPLAGKLQGGDYDGDIFWLCWEDKLVQPFENAPAPVASPDPKQYGISVNRQTLRDIGLNVNNERSVDTFLRKAFGFRATASLLGIVTVHHEKRSYADNKLKSFELDRLADVHDLLVDAAKQGYTFTLEDWHNYLRRTLKCEIDLDLPAYKRAMNDCASVKDSGKDVEKKRQTKYKYKRDNMIDFLYFDVVRSHNVATMKQIEQVLSSTTDANGKPRVDSHLLYPHAYAVGLQDAVITQEVMHAKEKMQKLYTDWNNTTHTEDMSKEEFARAVENLYARFTAIKPANVDHPDIKGWLHPWLRPDTCLWDQIRASILYAEVKKANAQTFVFAMAGEELARIKAANSPHARSIVAQIRSNMRPNAVRPPVPDDEGEEEELGVGVGV